ncbi:MAG: shikimate dehydrogenase [Bacteroidetes bacterium]|nr:shikimate dehydrogenase [Bacteroidota bacterium]MBS1930518.1 shikimate dehydrogenase [Bacteroidota bacterium]
MRLYGLIGYPLTHSFSKKYFTEKFEKDGLYSCRYQNFPIVSIDKFKTVLELNPELKGLNVTIPYKENIVPFLYEANDVVQKIRACNCIRIIDEKLYGYNTDVIGFEHSLIKGLQSFHNKALILGSGGAAKAVAFVLDKLHIEYRFVSRKKTASCLSYEEITPSVISEFRLIVNTTPLGMHPHISELPSIPYRALTPKHFLFDLIYNPEKTLFLKMGEEKNSFIKNGYEMLVNQAEESWKIWNS